MLIIVMKSNKHAGKTAVLFGKRINALRKNKKLTQEEMADKIGSSASMLSSIERGIRSPSLEMMEKIAGALDVPIRSLFEFFPEEIYYDSPAAKEIKAIVAELKQEPPRRVAAVHEIIKAALHRLK